MARAPDFFGPEPEAAQFTSTSVRRTGETTAVASWNVDDERQDRPGYHAGGIQRRG